MVNATPKVTAAEMVLEMATVLTQLAMAMPMAMVRVLAIATTAAMARAIPLISDDSETILYIPTTGLFDKESLCPLSLT